MGRHSIPGPGDEPDEAAESAGPAGERDGYGADGSFDDTSYGDNERGYERPGPGYLRGSDDPDSHYSDADDADGDYSDDNPADADYSDADYRATSSGGTDDPELFAAAEPPRTPPPRNPPTSTDGGGDWTGGHRVDAESTGSHRTVAEGRRGVSIGVIVALVSVVVLVAGVIVWRFFGDALTHRSDAAAGRCVDGDAAVAVLADPAIAEYVQQFAKTFNDNPHPVGDRCVAIDVKPAASDAVVNGFESNWPTDLGDRPALWIPGSSVSAARLQTVAGPQTVSDSRSLVSSPVVLAVRPELKPALAQQNWASLPGLQDNPTGLDGLDLAGWGPLRLALPMTGVGDASYLAAEAVAAASAPAGSPASVGVGAVNALVSGQPKLADRSADAAMAALLKGSDPATTPVHAVVTTEQQLFARASALPDAKNTVASWLPPGPVALADFPTVLLNGDWLSEEQVTAASEFARFMRKPEQLDALSKAGFRAEGVTPPSSAVVEFAPLAAPLSVGDDTMRANLADALTAPSSGPTVSIMLDRSMNLNNVTDALSTRIKAMPPNSAVGLTTFDGREGTTQVTPGPIADPVDGEPRTKALTDVLDGLSSTSDGAVSFTTLRNVYGDAQTDFRQGQTNSVLVITAGPHTDQSMDGSSLQEFVRSSADPSKPVAVNIINIGDDPDRASWEAVAQISGGTYRNVPSSDSPAFANALTTMLS